MSLLCPAMTPEQIQEYRNVFNMFDTDGNGAVSLSELGCAMRSLGMKPNEKELQEMMRDVDADGSGVIEFEEFLALVNKQVTEPDLIKQLEAVFHKFDSDKDGFLNAGDLVYALEHFAKTTMTEEEAVEVWEEGYCVILFFLRMRELMGRIFEGIVHRFIFLLLISLYTPWIVHNFVYSVLSLMMFQIMFTPAQLMLR